MTIAPLPEDQRLRAVDLSLVTVLALAWVAASVATSLTLWVLVSFIGTI
jgi:hypothetical protein